MRGDRGAGAVRTVGLPGGLRLQERLESFDEVGRSFRYAIIGKHSLPFRGTYTSSIASLRKKLGV